MLQFVDQLKTVSFFKLPSSVSLQFEMQNFSCESFILKEYFQERNVYL